MRTRSPRLAARVRAVCLLVCSILLPAVRAASQAPSQPSQILKDLAIEGATVFSREDVLWLLDLRPGERLPHPPEHIAERLQGHYKKEGYAAASVEGVFDSAAGRLTLRVDEGRIDEVEFKGVAPERAARFREALGVGPGDVYNVRRVREGLEPLLDETGGALRIGPGGFDLIPRDGRRILVIPIESRGMSVDFGVSSEGREDFFSPVDGFAPALSMSITRFDAERFRHTYVNGYVSYKFGREEPGYSAGFEQQLLPNQTLFVGASVHDLTASDDMWRLSTTEQSVVALTFKNTFRDYYRRRGTQVLVATRPDAKHEFLAAMRWDRHESLSNATDFAFFRDDHPYRPNQPIERAKVHALVLGYTWDSRGLAESRPGGAYSQHLLDDLFRGTRRQAFGSRVDWTSEIAGHGLGGDRDYDRHILNARAYVPMTPRQSVAGRLMLGFSGGDIPVEREFALGGIGSVHGYAFKEARGPGMVLFNAEYRLDLLGQWHNDSSGVLRGLLFFDAGRIDDPITASTSGWLNGIGAGLQTGPVRVEFGFRLNDIPDSLQVLVRLGSTF